MVQVLEADHSKLDSYKPENPLIDPSKSLNNRRSRRNSIPSLQGVGAALRRRCSASCLDEETARQAAYEATRNDAAAHTGGSTSLMPMADHEPNGLREDSREAWPREVRAPTNGDAAGGARSSMRRFSGMAMGVAFKPAMKPACRV